MWNPFRVNKDTKLIKALLEDNIKLNDRISALEEYTVVNNLNTTEIIKILDKLVTKARNDS